MVKIDSHLDEHERNALIDAAAPVLKDLKGVLGGFEDPELGHYGAGVYVRLVSRGLTFEQPVLEGLLSAARKHGWRLSVDTRLGPLVATFMM
jgi:hypothetical protein